MSLHSMTDGDFFLNGLRNVSTNWHLIIFKLIISTSLNHIKKNFRTSKTKLKSAIGNSAHILLKQSPKLFSSTKVTWSRGHFLPENFSPKISLLTKQKFSLPKFKSKLDDWILYWASGLWVVSLEPSMGANGSHRKRSFRNSPRAILMVKKGKGAF